MGKPPCSSTLEGGATTFTMKLNEQEGDKGV